MLNQDIYNDLLGYLGIEPGNGLPDTDARILQAINAAWQTLYTESPYFLRRAIVWNAVYGPPILALADLEIGVENPTLQVDLPGSLTAKVLFPLAALELSSYPHFLEAKRAYVQGLAASALIYLKGLTPQTQGPPLVYTGAPHTNGMIYNRLLRYIGLEPGNSTPDTDQLVLESMNGALQSIYTQGPSWFRKTKGMAVLPSPLTINIGVSKGSVDLTEFSQVAANMVGCTIQIPGEVGANEFVDQQTLLCPITQATGTVSATVYFNSYTLPANVVAVMGNVYLDGSVDWELMPYFYAEHQANRVFPSFPIEAYHNLPPGQWVSLRVGIPTGYYTAPAQKQAGAAFINRLMVWPLPDRQRTLSWDQEISAPQLTLDDLEIDNLAPTKTVTLPGALHEKVFVPLAALELAKSPLFLDGRIAIVQAQAATALSYLDSLTPQRQSGAVQRPRHKLPH